MAGAASFPERTAHASALFHAGLAPTIWLTNDHQRGPWSQELEENPLVVESARRELISDGVPQTRIEILPRRVDGTWDEGLYIRELTRQRPISALLIVTSPFHARRTRWTFERTVATTDVAVHVCPVPLEVAHHGIWSWWLSTAGWRNVAGELIKLIGYGVRYAAR